MKLYNKTLLRDMVLILSLAVVSGLSFNAVSVSGVSLLYQEVKPDSSGGITLEQMKKIVADQSMVILDARYTIYFNAGHIPGALSVPYNTRQLDSLMKDIDKDARIVTYCFSTHCPQADKLAGRLRAAGFSHVFVFHPGWRTWRAAGLPVEKGLKVKP